MKTTLRRPMLAALVTLSTAGMYFAQSVQDSTTSKTSEIEEVTLVGRNLSSVAKERKTPVALSIIRGSEISQKLGNREFPEIAKSTPSVYVTKSGGGYGEGKMTIRGFGQSNIAVIINGQPVNDMEGGTVYWSNWTGLADIASVVQIQRGLGASKLVVPSVGGTFNVVTKATENKQGGFVKVDAGSGYFQKATASYSTGLNDKGWATTVLLSRWAQEGLVKGTKGEGYTWFLSTAYKPSATHEFSFTATGAPQVHDNRRNTNYDTKYGEGKSYGILPTTLEAFHKYGKYYNPQYGTLNRGDYVTTPNFYHKPIATFNWDWNINDDLTMSTVIYGSWGRGGGGGGLSGSIDKPDPSDPTKKIDMNLYRANGTINYDLIYNYNSGQAVTDINGRVFQKQAYVAPAGSNTIYNGKYVIGGANDNSGMYRKQSVNSHDWYGGIVDLQYKPSNNWSINGGIDLKTYRGMHYQIATDLLGADAVYDNSDKNTYNGQFITQVVSPQPLANLKNNQKISYDNDGLVRWMGGYGQVEYSNNMVSAFVQASGSNQGYKRIDRFVDYKERETDWNNKWGYILKTGFNVNIDEHHNVFVNAGMISRQPQFSAVYLGNKQKYNEDSKNEKIKSVEAGYGFKSSLIDLNVNVYRTQWDDRYFSKSPKRDIYNNTFNLSQIHQGVELETRIKPTSFLRLRGMFSYGDWKYKGNDDTHYIVYDTNNQSSSAPVPIYVDDLNVGEAAQTTAGAGFDLTLFKGFSVDGSWEYYDRLYASFDPTAFTKEEFREKGVVRLPSYYLFDAGATYKLPVYSGARELIFRINVYNLLDTKYIAELNSNIHVDGSTYATYKGIDARNSGFLGFGRTWSASATFRF